MKRTIIALALASLFTTPALAGTYTSNTSCSRIYGGSTVCRSSFSTEAGSQRSVELTKEEVAEREANIIEWEAFCKPTGTVDKWGVTRLAYAHVGCEYGRRK